MSVGLSTGMILYGILVPIIEESLFRWLIFGRLRKILDPMAGIVISSVLFGVYHGNLVQGVYAFIMGMVFAYVYNCTNRIHTAFLMHGAANATVFFLARDSITFGPILTPVHCGIFLVIAAGCLYRFNKQYYPARG